MLEGSATQLRCPYAMPINSTTIYAVNAHVRTTQPSA